MKISVITVSYNCATTIQKTFNSVKNQTYPNIEYIVVDGNSTDGTQNIIQKNESFIDKWISEPDKGIYDGLNKGIAMATGEVIGLVHADDVLAGPGIIEEIAATFKGQNCDGVYGNLHYVTASNAEKIVRNWKSKAFETKLLKNGWMPAHPTLYLKSKVYKTYGVFNTGYKIAADYDFILRIFKQPELSFVYLPEIIIKMRVGGASNRDMKHILQKMREDLNALKANEVGSYPTLIKKNLSKLFQFYK